jgi:hypothetical protein
MDSSFKDQSTSTPGHSQSKDHRMRGQEAICMAEIDVVDGEIDAVDPADRRWYIAAWAP